MTAYTGTVTDSSGSYSLANQNLLELIQTNMETEGWTTLEFQDSASPFHLIMQGDGISTNEEIFVGFRSHESVGSDYYNITLAAFDGWVNGNNFTDQPGYQETTLCAHNLSIDYWMIINPQRFAIAMKVGTPVYDSGYVGRYNAYANPIQHPNPMCIMGPLGGLSATRYSNTTRNMPFVGNSVSSNLKSQVRDLNGIYQNSSNWPWFGDYLANGSSSERDCEDNYALNKIILTANNNVWGELDGVFHISGFNNVVENTLTISSVNYVVIQNIYRTSFSDYIALRLD